MTREQKITFGKWARWAFAACWSIAQTHMPEFLERGMVL